MILFDSLLTDRVEQQRLSAIAATVVAPERRSPDYLQKFVLSEIEKWAVPIRASGTQIE